MMKVADILRRKGNRVISIAPERTLWDAASMMAEHSIGALVVARPDGGMLGILSERDLVREVVAHPDQMRQRTVQQAMTNEVLVCSPEDSVRGVELTMRENKIRHLPVFEGRTLVGILSLRDVIATLLEATVEDANELRDALARHYVVC